MIKSVMNILFSRGGNAEDNFNLRLWFLLFTVFLATLTGVTLLTMRLDDNGGGFYTQRMWLLALYLFYMSLCCTFFPAPTAWLVLLMASPMFGLVSPGSLMDNFDIGDSYAGGLADGLTIIIVAAVGALGTSLANLNEYHIFTYLLRFGKVQKLKDARLYKTAAGYFAKSPFTLITAVSFLPVPVDIVRWLAISHRYNRALFFWANYLGRFLRYAIFAATAVIWQIGFVGIIVIQAGMLALMVVTRLVFKRIAVSN